jgi:hypothetical protein
VAGRGGGPPPLRDPFPFRASCVLAISTGLALNGSFEWIRMAMGNFPFMLDPQAPIAWAVPAGLAAVAVLVMIALAWMGRSSRTHLVLIELLLVGTIGATLTAYAELRDLNIDLDRAAPAAISASVNRLYVTYSHHRNTTTTHCNLELLGWPTPTTLARARSTATSIPA